MLVEKDLIRWVMFRRTVLKVGLRVCLLGSVSQQLATAWFRGLFSNPAAQSVIRFLSDRLYHVAGIIFIIYCTA